jgi:hypothetical protein
VTDLAFGRKSDQRNGGIARSGAVPAPMPVDHPGHDELFEIAVRVADMGSRCKRIISPRRFRGLCRPSVGNPVMMPLFSFAPAGHIECLLLRRPLGMNLDTCTRQ